MLVGLGGLALRPSLPCLVSCFPQAYNWLNDDQHGVKQPDATAFPNGACNPMLAVLAAVFNVLCVARVILWHAMLWVGLHARWVPGCHVEPVPAV